MLSIQIWYLWYFLYNILYQIYILYKLYHYSWNNNLIIFLYKRNIWFILENPNFVWLLTHFLVNINTTNIDSSDSIESIEVSVLLLFSHRRPTYVKSAFLFNQISTLKQHCVIKIESTWFFQRCFNIVLPKLRQPR